MDLTRTGSQEHPAHRRGPGRSGSVPQLPWRSEPVPAIFPRPGRVLHGRLRKGPLPSLISRKRSSLAPGSVRHSQDAWTSRCRRKARTWTICWFIDRTQPETGKFYLQWSATGVRKGTVVTVNNSGRVRGLTRPCRGLQACGEEARDAAPSFPGCVLTPLVAAPLPRLPRSGGVWTPPDHCQSPMSGSKRVNGRVGIDSGFCVNVIDPGG